MQTEATFQRAITEAFRRKPAPSPDCNLVGTTSGATTKRSPIETVSELVRLCYGHPLFLIGALWPLILLTPHFPGIPRPSIGGLPWRQELGLALLLTVSLGLLIKRKQTKKLARVDASTLPTIFTFGLFLCWILTSSAWSVNKYAAMHLGLQWTIYFVFFFLMNSVLRNPKMMRSSLVALMGVIWVLAIACAIESWFGAPLTDGNLRSDLKPILRGSGGFGEIMSMAAILFAGLSLHSSLRSRTLLYGATAVMGWSATLQSLERAPLIGAAVGFGLLLIGAAVLNPTVRPSWRRMALMVTALCLVGLLQSVPLRSGHSSQPVVTSTVSRFTSDLNADVSARARFLFWGIGLEMARAHPLLGVGGNNYEVMFAPARAEFALRRPNSSLIGMNEHLLTVYAHNEYVQLLAELGLIGFILFLLASLSLAAAFRRSLKNHSHALPALGAAGAMLGFAVSSGASGSSFRYFGGGMLFFFAAAMLARIAASVKRSGPDQPSKLTYSFANSRRLVPSALFGVMLFATCVLGAQGTGTVLHGLAQVKAEPAAAEQYYHRSLRIYPASPATHFGYGTWLYNQRRGAEAVPHLRYAVENGFNSSICYSYLAGAADSSGNLVLAEQTMAAAVRVYPTSLFLLVRHADLLKRSGRTAESNEVFSRALALNSRAARGWQQLIEKDIDAAYVAAKNDKGIALPGELYPEAAVLQILQENEQRFPAQPPTGWRARMRAQQSK